MIKGKLIDENNIQYDVMIERKESNDFDVYDFFNKYVFAYEIKRAVGRNYFVIYRYVLNRYREILNEYKIFEPYSDTAFKYAACFASKEEAKTFLDEQIAKHEYNLDKNTTPEIVKY